jgi:hypothetical protein
MTKALVISLSIENRTVTPTRLPNAAPRTREHLTEAEVEPLGASRRDDAPGRVSARFAVCRACGPSLGSDRIRSGRGARP